MKNIIMLIVALLLLMTSSMFSTALCEVIMYKNVVRTAQVDDNRFQVHIYKDVFAVPDSGNDIIDVIIYKVPEDKRFILTDLILNPYNYSDRVEVKELPNGKTRHIFFVESYTAYTLRLNGGIVFSPRKKIALEFPQNVAIEVSACGYLVPAYWVTEY
jgi:hypothetical protein